MLKMAMKTWLPHSCQQTIIGVQYFSIPCNFFVYNLLLDAAKYEAYSCWNCVVKRSCSSCKYTVDTTATSSATVLMFPVTGNWSHGTPGTCSMANRSVGSISGSLGRQASFQTEANTVDHERRAPGPATRHRPSHHTVPVPAFRTVST